MSYSAVSQRVSSIGFISIVAFAMLGVTALALWASPSAPAAPLVAKDGKIHACYKSKGAAKGTLRVVRSAKVRCPRRWKKVAWSATGPAGAPGPQGAPGAAGDPGARGEVGLPGTAGNVVVTELEDKVTELLTRVQSLEGVLAGIDNAQLQKAIAAIPAVQALCAQSVKLNEQTTKLGESTAALNTILDVLILTFVPVEVPTALPAFSCPSF
jgi:hypothetical protein